MKGFCINLRVYFSEGISYLVAFLMVYAAVSKLLEFEDFQAQLGQSPLISAYAGAVSYSLLPFEFLVALLLVIRPTRGLGLHLAATLMVLFTAYIITILHFSPEVPCSCGGILEQMDWSAHLLFNLAVLAVIFLSLMFMSSNYKRTIGLFSLEVLLGSLTMGLLYQSSEYLMHKENPFQRRFISGSCVKKSEVALSGQGYYFVGASSNTIYLSHIQRPQYIIVYDTLLQVKRQFKIKLDQERLKFHAIQVKVAPPYFYVLDGTLPIIFRGNIADWRAKTLLQEQGYYFSRATIIDSSQIAFRAQQQSDGQNVLGLFRFKPKLVSSLQPRLLQKQIDGFFDTDGTMRYNAAAQTFVYTYYYRNQFIVTDQNLRLRYRGKTIDSTTQAKIKVAVVNNNGRRKLASPGQVINKVTCLRDNLLLVYSTLHGRYEASQMWDIASSVDVYDTASNQYVSSLYIYDSNKAKVSDMITVGDNLYAITGSTLQHYKLGRNLSSKNFKTLPAGNRANDRKPVQ